MIAALGNFRASLDYDQAATSYARHRGVHPGVVQELVERAALSASSRVLDVGCGTGNYGRVLRSIAGCHMFGIEPSARMRARAEGATTWESLTAGQAESLPFPDGSFDLVMSTDVIHHLGNREAYFREAARVLVPGGQVVTVTDSREDLARRRPLTSHFPETLIVELERYPDEVLLVSEMEHAGFADLRLENVALEYELTDIQVSRSRVLIAAIDR